MNTNLVKKLQALYDHGDGASGYPPGAYKGFLKGVNFMQNAESTKSLIATRSLNFEKLKKWKHKGKFSIKANDQYRIILDVKKHLGFEIIEVLELTKHYE